MGWQPPDLVATIDDWKADNDNVAEIVAAMSSAGAFPLEPTETFQGRPFMTDDTSSAACLCNSRYRSLHSAGKLGRRWSG